MSRRLLARPTRMQVRARGEGVDGPQPRRSRRDHCRHASGADRVRGVWDGGEVPMSRDNSTGKDKEFYERGKKMFDRLNPPGTPEFKPYFPKREWVGLTDEELQNIAKEFWSNTQRLFREHWDEIVAFMREAEAKLKERNT
jgi:hypothetical protein